MVDRPMPPPLASGDGGWMERVSAAPPIGSRTDAGEQRALELRQVLDRAGPALGTEAMRAAQELLELGFPHAFQLTPEELVALRSSKRVRSRPFQLLSGLGVLWVVSCGALNAFIAA